MGNVLAVLALAGLAVLFIVLAIRAGKARRLWIKWPGMLLSGLLGLLFLIVTGVALFGFYKLNVAPASYPVSNVQVALTPEKVARGEQLANICLDCHSSTGGLPLDGSKENILSGPGLPPVGDLWGTNLTPGGPLQNWTDGEILRAIREGIDKDGKPLLVMPSVAFHAMSDEDAQALVAYLRSQPAVQRDLPDRDMNVIAALIVGAGMFPVSAQEPIREPIIAPAQGTVEYGEYLINMAGCEDCHGPKLDGVGLYGPGVNLTVIVPNWTEEEFVRMFREGVDPKTNRPIDPMSMPVLGYGKVFSDDDLRDIYSFMHRLQPTTDLATQ